MSRTVKQFEIVQFDIVIFLYHIFKLLVIDGMVYYQYKLPADITIQ